MSEVDQNSQISSDEKESRQLSALGSATDHAFLPTWVLGCMVAVIAVITVVVGWKVITLDAERVLIVQEREKLEVDKKTYEELLVNLPQLIEKKRSFDDQLAMLRGEIEVAVSKKEMLGQQAEEASTVLNNAEAALKQVEAREKASREAKAELEAEIERFRTESSQLRQLVLNLDKQKTKLQEDISARQNDKSQLEADVAGLERQKINTKKILDTMSSDVGDLQSLAKRFDQLAKSMEDSQEVANKAVKSLSASSGSLSQTVSHIENESEGLSKQSAMIGAEVSNLEKATKSVNNSLSSLQDASKGIGVQRKSFEQEVKDMNLAVREIESRTKDLDSLITKSTSHSLKYSDLVASFGNVVSDAKENAADLKTTASKIEQEIALLNSASISVQNNSSDVAGAVTAFSESNDKLSNMLREFDSAVVASKRNTTAFQNVARDIGRVKSDLDSIYKQLENGSSGLDRVESKLQDGRQKQDQLIAEMERNLELLSTRLNEVGESLKEAAGLREEIERLLKVESAQ